MTSTITGKQLIDAGWPEGPLIGTGLQAARKLAFAGQEDGAILTQLGQVAADPAAYVDDAVLGGVAAGWMAIQAPKPAHSHQLRSQPVPYVTWGANLIDPNAMKQIERAARLPIAKQAAVMPDAHVGYGLPIGGVLATEGAVIPYAVGVDIACRMRLSVCPVSPHLLDQKRGLFENALIEQTRFGPGVGWARDERPDHAVLESKDWAAIPFVNRLKQKAWEQLGSSGGGNHFVEWGILTVGEEDAKTAVFDLASGKYIALLSHSGSRGLGASIAKEYTTIAQHKHAKLDKKYRELAWLSLDSEAGQEYWLAMNLAGRYAAANHAVIHERVLAAAGLEPIASVENHHNFAWREQLADGSDVIVHRKGATPAGEDVLGVIPGSMGDPAYVVSGLGQAEAINSASHGAGRKYGRSEAFRVLEPKRWQEYLRKRNVTLIGGSLDESPQAYKKIDDVMAAQQDLVAVVAQFMPRIVRMAEAKQPKWRRDKQRRKKQKRRRSR
ncbi:MAG: RtcB family protein [Chloroflexota bacterium]